jgi:hypothetical protein
MPAPIFVFKPKTGYTFGAGYTVLMAQEEHTKHKFALFS